MERRIFGPCLLGSNELNASKGVTSKTGEWADLGLLLVEKLLGQAGTLETASFLVVDPPRRSQNQYKASLPRFDHGDKEVLQVQHQFHATPEMQKSIGELVGSVRLSERKLQRRFFRATRLKLTEYLQNVRIMKARQLLEKRMVRSGASHMQWVIQIRPHSEKYLAN